MDNYLAHRWPAQKPAAPANIQPAKKKKSRRWRDALIIGVAVLVLCCLVAGSFFGVRYAAERIYREEGNSSGDAVNTPDTGGSSKPGRPDLAGDWTPDKLPRSEYDPSVQIVLQPRTDEERMAAAEIYEKLLPSMVCVEASSSLGIGVGSGIIISESGYILTNYHVIEDGTSLTVMRLSDYAEFEAGLVGYDKELDLAVLKAEGDGFVPAEIGDSDELRVGEQVYAIGNPLGYLYGTMTDGIVSALSEDRTAALDYPGRLIQTTAALNSGNSGGALVDSYGRVVGITSAKITGVLDNGSNVVEGLGLAIPISDARPYLNRILRTGVSSRPSIGISCTNARMGEVSGILVAEVVIGTPAARVMKPGDFIIGANGVTIENVDDLTRIFAELDPGDIVTLTVIRDGETITVNVGLYERLPETEAD